MDGNRVARTCRRKNSGTVRRTFKRCKIDQEREKAGLEGEVPGKERGGQYTLSCKLCNRKLLSIQAATSFRPFVLRFSLRSRSVGEWKCGLIDSPSWIAAKGFGGHSVNKASPGPVVVVIQRKWNFWTAPRERRGTSNAITWPLKLPPICLSFVSARLVPTRTIDTCLFVSSRCPPVFRLFVLKPGFFQVTLAFNYFREKLNQITFAREKKNLLWWKICF